MDRYREANRALWNAWTPINVASGDVRGRSLLHLQCHFGMDTIRWARRGAVVTGVDFAENAVTAARALAAQMGVSATFVLSDLYALPGALEGRFDVVFTSHGVLCWLPDLDGWARVVAHFLAPGGLFYIVEAHPLLLCQDDRAPAPELRLRYPYFQGAEPVLKARRPRDGA